MFSARVRKRAARSSLSGASFFLPSTRRPGTSEISWRIRCGRCREYEWSLYLGSCGGGKTLISRQNDRLPPPSLRCICWIDSECFCRITVRVLWKWNWSIARFATETSTFQAVSVSKYLLDTKVPRLTRMRRASAVLRRFSEKITVPLQPNLGASEARKRFPRMRGYIFY